MASDIFLANPALALLQAREVREHRINRVDRFINTLEDDYGRASVAGSGYMHQKFK